MAVIVLGRQIQVRHGAMLKDCQSRFKQRLESETSRADDRYQGSILPVIRCLCSLLEDHLLCQAGPWRTATSDMGCSHGQLVVYKELAVLVMLGAILGASAVFPKLQLKNPRFSIRASATDGFVTCCGTHARSDWSMGTEAKTY
jgi:hypothetical protein